MTRRPTDLRYENGKIPPYEAIRRHVLAQEPTCRLCGTASATEVDHIWPRYFGGDDSRANLQGVCSPCNKAKGNRVHRPAATTEQLTQAIEAIVARLTAAGDELDLFTEGISWHRPLASESSGFRMAVDQLDFVVSRLRGISAFCCEVVAEAREEAQS